jgi:penicillin amidase
MKNVARIVSRVLLRKAWPRTRGRVSGLPLEGDVEVARDRWGIPHITAGSMHDLLLAQGWVHAQDRLWQMETLRRVCTGRVSEIAGPGAVNLDWFCRMSGMPEMRRRVLNGMSDEERSLCQAYAEGVNACVGALHGRLPLEFATLKLSPEPWTAEDCASSLPYIAFTQTFGPWATKLLAVSRAGRLSEEEWNDMLPVHPGADLPHEAWFDRSAGLKFGAIHPGAFALHAGYPGPQAAEGPGSGLASAVSGSNNWAVAKGEDGSPLLANDPHMGVTLPAVWYFCHLRIPGSINAAGTSLAGSPGVVLGRTERAAWAVTNFQLDSVDVLTFQVDPEDPKRYFTPRGPIRMREEPLTIGLPRGRSVTLPLYLTESGPVITSLEKGVNAAAVMRWHGTVSHDAVQDRSFRGVFGFMKAASAADVMESCRNWKYVSMNFVAADADGHLGWQVSGAAPARRGYSGRLPGDASAGEDWEGFLPEASLPRVMDPAEGCLVTANHRPQNLPPGPALSHSWCAPYRHARILSALRGMSCPGVKDFQALQMDVHSGQADRILPRLLGVSFGNPLADEAARLLAGWDREVRAESAGAAVFEVFLGELTRCLLGERLGSDLGQYFNCVSYGVENEILERLASPLWNGDWRSAVGTALAHAMASCEQRMGGDRRRWSWGRLHRNVFHHRGATTRLGAWLLDPPSFPAHGDSNTVNVSWWCPGDVSWDATSIPSMRMIAALGDPDGLYVIGPLGQSGQPGHRHYDDLTIMWREGKLVRVPLTEAAVRKAARERLVLSKA